jgi:glycosyltransferase involved in cell wall biosynthesis
MLVHSQFPVGEPRGERHARALAEIGYQVNVVCLRLPGQPKFDRVNGIEITRLPVRHIRGAGRLRMVTEYFRFIVGATLTTLALNRRSRFDVVYVHAPPDFLVLSALLPHLRGAKIVLDIHDLTPHMYEARFGHRRDASATIRTLRLIERWACAVADQVVTVHEPYRRELVANGVAPGKVAIVMNSPDEADIEQIKRRKSSVASKGFTVAYHGTVTHWYGVDLLIRALGRLTGQIPGLNAVILGEGDALDDAERLANEYGIKETIEFSRRYVAHIDALSRVASANCGVIPNRRSQLNRFALSSKLLEYVALGVPVVVSRLETLSAHFSPDEVTFFEPDDDLALAEAIRWVAEHPAEAEEKARCARRRAEGYSWARSRSTLLHVLSPRRGMKIDVPIRT